MQASHPEQNRGRVLLLEPNAALRSAVTTILSAEHYQVERVDALDAIVERAHSTDNHVALVAWQSMQGLLSDGRRDELSELTQRLRLVLMVPRHWWRLLEGTDVPKIVTALIAKPFHAEELIAALDQAFATKLEVDSVTR